MYGRLLPVALAALLCAPRLAAQPTIASDRPGIGSGATVVRHGTLQFEGGFAFSRDATSERYAIGQVLVRAGAPWFEVQLLANSYVVSREDFFDDAIQAEGFEDIGVGVKLPLVRTRDDSFTLSLQGLVTAPSGSEIFTGDEWVPAVNLLADMALTDRVALSLNGGYQAGPGVVDDVVSLIVTPGFSLGGGFGAYGGWAGLFSGGADAHFAETGLTYLVDGNLQLDLNGGWDVESDDWFIGAGVAIRRTRR